MLQDILSPYIGENRASAEHTGTFHNGCGTDTTRPEPTQEWGRVETPDWFLTGIEDRAENSAWRILEEIIHVLGKRKEGTVPPSTKWQRLNDSESDTHSEAQSVAVA